jgi:hypothetical protein
MFLRPGRFVMGCYRTLGHPSFRHSYRRHPCPCASRLPSYHRPSSSRYFRCPYPRAWSRGCRPSSSRYRSLPCRSSRRPFAPCFRLASCRTHFHHRSSRPSGHWRLPRTTDYASPKGWDHRPRRLAEERQTLRSEIPRRPRLSKAKLAPIVSLQDLALTSRLEEYTPRGYFIPSGLTCKSSQTILRRGLGECEQRRLGQVAMRLRLTRQ